MASNIYDASGVVVDLPFDVVCVGILKQKIVCFVLMCWGWGAVLRAWGSHGEGSS